MAHSPESRKAFLTGAALLRTAKLSRAGRRGFIAGLAVVPAVLSQVRISLARLPAVSGYAISGADAGITRYATTASPARRLPFSRQKACFSGYAVTGMAPMEASKVSASLTETRRTTFLAEADETEKQTSLGFFISGFVAPTSASLSTTVPTTEPS